MTRPHFIEPRAFEFRQNRRQMTLAVFVRLAETAFVRLMEWYHLRLDPGFPDGPVLRRTRRTAVGLVLLLASERSLRSVADGLRWRLRRLIPSTTTRAFAVRPRVRPAPR